MEKDLEEDHTMNHIMKYEKCMRYEEMKRKVEEFEEWRTCLLYTSARMCAYLFKKIVIVKL